MKKLNQIGQTLVGVMVAAAVGATVILNVQRGMMGAVNGANDINSRQDFSSVSRVTHTILANQKKCDNAFAGVDLTPFISPVAYPSPSSVPFVNVSLQLGNQTVSSGTALQNASITTVALYEPDPTLRTANSGTTTFALKLDMQATKRTFMGSKKLDQTNLLFLKARDSDHRVVSCDLGDKSSAFLAEWVANDPVADGTSCVETCTRRNKVAIIGGTITVPVTGDPNNYVCRASIPGREFYGARTGYNWNGHIGNNIQPGCAVITGVGLNYDFIQQFECLCEVE